MIRKLLYASLFLGAPLFAANYDWQTAVNSQPSVAVVPTTSTAVVSVSAPRYVKVDQINLHNVSASSVTVTITDNSTNCNGAACAVAATPISIPANTSYVITLGGQAATGGVSWSASAANAVEGWIGGRY